jgi:hypothetical protein
MAALSKVPAACSSVSSFRYPHLDIAPWAGARIEAMLSAKLRLALDSSQPARACANGDYGYARKETGYKARLKFAQDTRKPIICLTRIRSANYLIPNLTRSKA